MITLPVYNQSGKKIGAFEIAVEGVASHINKQLLHDAVVMYQANQRQGSVKTKGRGEVRGTTKKLYRQKGTGNARAGSRRSGVRRGGGHIFSIQSRDHSYRLTRKAARLATRMAIAAKIRDNEVIVVDSLKFEIPKTKEMASLLTALKLRSVRLLLATDTYEPTVYRSARNIPGLTVIPVTELNALVILDSERILMTRSAIDLWKTSTAGGA